jgi:hypothetical protein
MAGEDCKTWKNPVANSDYVVVGRDFLGVVAGK